MGNSVTPIGSGCGGSGGNKTDQITRLTAARWQGEQALYTEAVRLLSERPAPPDDLSLRAEAEVRAEAWAAAIEGAASICDIQAGLSCADDYDSGWCDCAGTLSGWIRGMSADDASAALDRIKAEVRAEGMLKAAQRAALMIELGFEWPATTRGKVDAILAAIPEARK